MSSTSPSTGAYGTALSDGEDRAHSHTMAGSYSFGQKSVTGGSQGLEPLGAADGVLFLIFPSYHAAAGGGNQVAHSGTQSFSGSTATSTSGAR